MNTPPNKPEIRDKISYFKEEKYSFEITNFMARHQISSGYYHKFITTTHFPLFFKNTDSPSKGHVDLIPNAYIRPIKYLDDFYIVSVSVRIEQMKNDKFYSREYGSDVLSCDLHYFIKICPTSPIFHLTLKNEFSHHINPRLVPQDIPSANRYRGDQYFWQKTPVSQSQSKQIKLELEMYLRQKNKS